MNILFVCTGNSCRSPMAEGILKSIDPTAEVISAGASPEKNVSIYAVAVMKEIGIDISHHTSDSVDLYLGEEWDYVITVCGGANEACPAFVGKVKHRLHIGFEDPSNVTGTDEFIWSEFRRVRDLIREQFYKLYIEQLKK